MNQSTYEPRRGGRDGDRMRADYDRDRDREAAQRSSWQDRRYEGEADRGRNGGAAYGDYAETRGRPQMQGMAARDRYEQSEPHEANIVKVIEVVAESERGWEDAAQKAVFEASRSVRNIKSVYIKDMSATVSHARITHYRLVAKISFAIEQ